MNTAILSLIQAVEDSRSLPALDRAAHRFALADYAAFIKRKIDEEEARVTRLGLYG